MWPALMEALAGCLLQRGDKGNVVQAEVRKGPGCSAGRVRVWCALQGEGIFL